MGSTLVRTDTILFSNNVNVSINAQQLREGTLKISAGEGNDLAITRAKKAIAKMFSEQGKDVLFYTKFESNQPFTWLAVPFDRNVNIFKKYWNQLVVLWRIRFGGYYNDTKVTDIFVKTFINSNFNKYYKEGIKESFSLYNKQCEKQAFCNEINRNKQLIFNGKHTYVLYNIKQVGQEKKDFLVVPKNHVEADYGLTDEEATEMSFLTTKIVKFFEQKRSEFKVHIFHKNGEYAGQTVKHIHTHLLFEKKSTPESTTMWSVVKNMFFGRRLSDRDVIFTSQKFSQEMSTCFNSY